MYKNSLTIVFFIICLVSVLPAQIDFVDLPLEDALDMAKEQDKSIFIDVYTTWCGPCKRLDRETFIDPKVGAFMDEHFISLKWDAESEEHRQTTIAFDVTSYPSLLFLNTDGKIVAKHIGFKNSATFLQLAQSFNHLMSDLTTNGDISSPKALSIEEKTNTLLLLQDVEYEHKEALFASFYTDVEVMNDTMLSICIDNFNVSTIHVFDKIHANLPTVSPFDVKGLSKSIEREFKLRSKISNIKRSAIATNDFDLLKTSFEMDSLLNLKSANSRSNAEIQKDHQTSLLQFYKDNQLKQEYIDLADELVSRFITIHTVAEFKSEDERLYKIGSSMLKMMSKDSTDQDEVTEEMGYETKYMLSCAAANRLLDISQTYISFEESDAKIIGQALDWSKMATELCPTAKTHIQYIHILKSAGKIKEALSVTHEAKLRTDFKDEIDTFNILLEDLTK